jgi:hypothetical protein
MIGCFTELSVFNRQLVYHSNHKPCIDLIDTRVVDVRVKHAIYLLRVLISLVRLSSFVPCLYLRLPVPVIRRACAA